MNGFAIVQALDLDLATNTENITGRKGIIIFVSGSLQNDFNDAL